MTHLRRHRSSLLFAVTGLAGMLAAASLWVTADAPGTGVADATHPRRTEAPAERGTARVPAAARVAAADGAAAGVWAAPAGAGFRYALDDHTRYGFLPADEGRAPPAALHTSGTLVARVVARTSDAIAVAMTFEGLAFQDGDGRSNGADPLVQRFTAAARTPVMVKLDLDGRVAGYRFAGELDGEQRNFLRGMVAPFAFTVPIVHGDEWRAVERDTLGAFEASYGRHAGAPGDALALRRTKVRYTDMGAELRRHELSGGADAAFGQEIRWLRRAAVDEDMTLDLGLRNLRVTFARRAKLVLASTFFEASAVDTAALEGPWSPAEGSGEQRPQGTSSRLAQHWARRLAGVDLASVVDELRAVAGKDPVDRQALDAVFQKLTWLARTDGDNATKLAELARAGALTGDAAAVAMGALGAAGTPAAQAALVAVREDRSLAADVREAATVAMIQLATPGARLVDSLLAHAGGSDGGEREAALLVLGAVAPRCQEPLAAGHSALQALLRLETDATLRNDVPTWLRALGNAGHAATLAAAARYLDHPTADVRAAACTALRRVEVHAATQELVARGLVDGDPAVRAAAADALGERGERGDADACAALRTVVALDAATGVRRTALLALGRQLQDPANRAAIGSAASTDPDASLRRLAASLLQGS